jgi:hypothetical protein
MICCVCHSSQQQGHVWLLPHILLLLLLLLVISWHYLYCTTCTALLVLH